MTETALSGWAITRRILAAGIAVAALTLAVSGYIGSGPKRCSQELDDKGTPVEVCSSPEVTDPPVVLGLLLAGLLLAPDVTSFSFGGVDVKLGRDEVDKRLADLETRIKNISRLATEQADQDKRVEEFFVRARRVQAGGEG